MTEITPDMRALAEAVLKGDRTAAMALSDCLQENVTSKVERISVRYVEMIEDALRDYRTEIKKVASTPALERCHWAYSHCERMARSLGRQGLS